jgi:hypothetical protein
MDREKMLYAVIGAVLLGFAAFATIEGHHAVLRDDDSYEVDAQGNRAAIARALTFAKVSLQQGLDASELEGQPISGKFEIDRGKFQLLVYTSKDGKFSEVLVDYSTGNIEKVLPITEGNDLAAAKSQSAVMAKAKSSLKQGVEKVVRAAAASRAISVVPGMRDGHAVASVMLFLKKEQKFREVQEGLD